ncbi:MAG: glycosyltransferase family 4 protein [Acidobacteriota bacterium]
MRIAWVCPYPASAFRSRPSLRQSRKALHPVPWVTIQAPLVAAAAGVELHVVTVARDYSADDHFEHQGIHFHFLRVPRVPRALLWYQLDRRRIHQCLDAIRPDLVQGFGTEGSFGYAAATSGYPALIRMQGIMGRIVPALGARALLRNPGWIVPIVIERLTVRRCRQFICPSQFAADYVRQVNPSAQVHLVRTPVRLEYFSIQRDPAPSTRPELLFLGSVLPAKGIEVLLEAMVAIVAEFPGTVLHVAGAGEPGYIDHVLKPLLARTNLVDVVLLHGFQSAPQVCALMARASLLVLPTFMDTSPNVVSEAQIAGVPVVATRVGGIPEVIEHRRTGLLVEPHSAGALADAILDALRHPRATAAMADAARAEALVHHDPETQVAKLVDIYRDMVAAAPLPAVRRMKTTLTSLP